MTLRQWFHNDVEEAYKESQEFLKNQPELDERIEEAGWAMNELGDLYPETLEKFWSGHYFPFIECNFELKNSIDLCLGGMYRYAFIGLRSVLELGILGVYLDIEDKSHIAVKPWMDSQIRTPSPKTMMNALVRMPYFSKFDHRFGLREEVKIKFEMLGTLVHVKGYRASSTGHTRSNRPAFQSPSLKKYCDTMFDVVRLVSIITLLKYPIGIVPVPLDEKFGMNGPVGGFLQEYQVKKIQSFLKEEERSFLRDLAENDKDIQSIVAQIEAMPDVTEEEMISQVAEM